jgi:transposase
MLNLPPSVRVYLCTMPQDLRRSFDGLAMLAEHVLQASPFTGHLFVFRNKHGEKVKVLYWDRDGFAIWYKRLEKGRFRFPERVGARLEMSATDLAILLEGIDLTTVKRPVRYVRPEAEKSDFS